MPPDLVYFTTGSALHKLRGEFLRCFNRRDYAGAASVLVEIERIVQERGSSPELSRMTVLFLRGTLQVATGDLAAAEVTFTEAELAAETPIERATALENLAGLRIKQHRDEEAMALCERGIDVYPTVAGLWVNLLVALDRLGHQDAIGAALEGITRLFDLSANSTIALLLRHDPDLEGVRAHPDYQTFIAPKTS